MQKKREREREKGNKLVYREWIKRRHGWITRKMELSVIEGRGVK